MSTVLVLSGGGQSEHDVSIRSGRAVTDALRDKGYTVIPADPAKGFSVPAGTDVIFPALHGLGGEDGSLQIMFERIGVPFVGSDALASSLCFDKWRYRQVLGDAGIDVANGKLVTKDTLWSSTLTRQPFVLKPYDGGSSVDTFIVRDVTAADHDRINEGFVRHSSMLLEELIDGIEITVGILGDKALPAVEIIPPKDGEFDYENKYNGRTQELCPPLHIDEATHRQAQDIALRIHRLVGCRDISRTDMIVTPARRIVVLETNTLPGFTNESLFPKAAGAIGLSFSELTDKLVRLALERK